MVIWRIREYLWFRTDKASMFIVSNKISPLVEIHYKMTILMNKISMKLVNPNISLSVKFAVYFCHSTYNNTTSENGCKIHPYFVATKQIFDYSWIHNIHNKFLKDFQENVPSLWRFIIVRNYALLGLQDFLRGLECLMFILPLIRQ